MYFIDFQRSFAVITWLRAIEGDGESESETESDEGKALFGTLPNGDIVFIAGSVCLPEFCGACCL
jgi:hypothetical protein